MVEDNEVENDSAYTATDQVSLNDPAEGEMYVYNIYDSYIILVCSLLQATVMIHLLIYQLHLRPLAMQPLLTHPLPVQNVLPYHLPVPPQGVHFLIIKIVGLQ